MKLDQTFIAIRERNTLEIFDLALQVTREHFSKLLWLLAIGAAPWIILDWILIGWIITSNIFGHSNFSYYWLMLILVFSQAQIGTAMITYYLGRSMFTPDLTVPQTIRESLWPPPFFWWLHGVVRLVIPVLGIAMWLWWLGPGFIEGAYLMTFPLVMLAFLIRSNRPYVTEIILLEQTPVRSESPHRINFSRRSSNLHINASGTLFNQTILVCLFLPLLGLSFYSAFNLFDDAVALQPGFEFPLRSLYWIAALWLSAGFAAVVRFLCYIDLRIRQEGWAVELKMRAEALKLTGDEA